MNLEILRSKEVAFVIAKIIAESDSIGEQYSYCHKYTREAFDCSDPFNPELYDPESYIVGYREAALQVQEAIIKVIEETV